MVPGLFPDSTTSYKEMVNEGKSERSEEEEDQKRSANNCSSYLRVYNSSKHQFVAFPLLARREMMKTLSAKNRTDLEK